MKAWKTILPVTALLLWSGQSFAQDAEEKARAAEAKEVEYSERLREAEERLERAAREIAEITSERLPELEMIERRFDYSKKPRIGITIDGVEDSGPVEGVAIGGVTPSSPADEAGLRAGDIITAANGESFTAESSYAANILLMKFMKGVEEGDKLKLEYLRNGNVGTVELAPRVMEMRAFTWMPDMGEQFMEAFPGAPDMVREFKIERGFPFMGGTWSSMELVALNAGLGQYFGTNTGLLVISAPKSDSLQLQDGDVIQSIDGRIPTDVRHALRILNSYKSGETLQLGIMRDKRERTLNIQIPADHHGSLFMPLPVKPARAPVAPLPVVGPVTSC